MGRCSSDPRKNVPRTNRQAVPQNQRKSSVIKKRFCPVTGRPKQNKGGPPPADPPTIPSPMIG